MILGFFCSSILLAVIINRLYVIHVTLSGFYKGIVHQKMDTVTHMPFQICMLLALPKIIIIFSTKNYFCQALKWPKIFLE